MLKTIEDALPGLVAMRRDMHAHPELSREEAWTADFVAGRLREIGVEVHTGIGGHGVVATIRGSAPGPAVALRADMDALAIEERTGRPYASRNPGRMHACGHDGHMAMLIGAATHLAATRRFRGTVQLWFQPAEERYGGAQIMIDDGLFDRFPAQRVFGLHNWPGLRAGAVVVHDGPVMAGTSEFEAVFSAKGGHAAMPHTTGDPILAGSLFVAGLQQIVARAVDPQHAAVVTVGSFRAGHAQNIIPDRAVLAGTFRAFSPHVLAAIRERLEAMATSAAAMAGAQGILEFDELVTPPVVNTPAEAGVMREAAAELAAGSLEMLPPSMAGDDFGVFLAHLPGAYAWIGNGLPGESAALHLPDYDFNDAILGHGASLLARTAERALA
jgi:hippurate hydrolase